MASSGFPAKPPDKAPSTSEKPVTVPATVAEAVRTEEEFQVDNTASETAQTETAPLAEGARTETVPAESVLVETAPLEPALVESVQAESASTGTAPVGSLASLATPSATKPTAVSSAKPSAKPTAKPSAIRSMAQSKSAAALKSGTASHTTKPAVGPKTAAVAPKLSSATAPTSGLRRAVNPQLRPSVAATLLSRPAPSRPTPTRPVVSATPTRSSSSRVVTTANRPHGPSPLKNTAPANPPPRVQPTRETAASSLRRAPTAKRTAAPTKSTPGASPKSSETGTRQPVQSAASTAAPARSRQPSPSATATEGGAGGQTTEDALPGAMRQYLEQCLEEYQKQLLKNLSVPILRASQAAFRRWATLSGIVDPLERLKIPEPGNNFAASASSFTTFAEATAENVAASGDGGGSGAVSDTSFEEWLILLRRANRARELREDEQAYNVQRRLAQAEKTCRELCTETRRLELLCRDLQNTVACLQTDRTFGTHEVVPSNQMNAAGLFENNEDYDADDDDDGSASARTRPNARASARANDRANASLVNDVEADAREAYVQAPDQRPVRRLPAEGLEPEEAEQHPQRANSLPPPPQTRANEQHAADMAMTVDDVANMPNVSDIGESLHRTQASPVPRGGHNDDGPLNDPFSSGGTTRVASSVDNYYNNDDDSDDDSQPGVVSQLQATYGAYLNANPNHVLFLHPYPHIAERLPIDPRIDSDSQAGSSISEGSQISSTIDSDSQAGGAALHQLPNHDNNPALTSQATPAPQPNDTMGSKIGSPVDSHAESEAGGVALLQAADQTFLNANPPSDANPTNETPPVGVTKTSEDSENEEN